MFVLTDVLCCLQQYIVAKVELLREEMVKDMQVLAHNTRIAKKKYDWDEETARKNFKIAVRWKKLFNVWKAFFFQFNFYWLVRYLF